MPRREFQVGRPKRPPHKAAVVPVKYAEVDRGILPTVRWLNSFAGVATRWACQGDDDGHDRPYVTFTCDCPFEMIRVLDGLYGFAETEVEFYRPVGGLRYVARFRSPALLAEFQSRLRRPKR
jgi:hypothetical protein